ncbi:hypothetical protein DICVIV_04631 [Dictyocaulus viviparus]|uniref:BZIP domain-containing protein n=1 Tax=Dictyocaulus viviparus TaxID=29172 RepID=A0A0D8Y3W8_DICVI|nr:hypothetical protein DICVIV_04631 [Dictyocaulus viviparus]
MVSKKDRVSTTSPINENLVIVMPVMTERAGLHLVRISGQLSPTTSTASSVQAHDPSLEDIELIDVLWRGDIAAEKGAREVGLADQYERDLQLLTEKSIHAPLSNEESSRFEDLSKAYFEDFYATPYLLCSGVKSQSRFEQCREFSANKEPPTDNCLTASTPTDPNYGKLFESFKEGVQLDHHFCGDIRSQSDLDSLPLVNNVSLSEGIVFTAQNVSEMSLIHEHQQTALAAISSPPAPASLYNETSVPALWMQQADIAPSDKVQVVSTGIQNDHQYCSSTHYYNETPSCQLQSVFDLYHSTRNTSLTDESLGSSTSTSASPRYYRETKNSSPHSSRYFGKLAPKEVERTIYPKKFYGYNGYNGVLSNTHTHAIPRRRGRQSKDEQLAAANQLPLSAREISEMTLGELNRTLKNLNLTELQKQLIRKIRRRGKNKLAARTCRERRGERQRNLLGVGSQWKDLNVCMIVVAMRCHTVFRAKQFGDTFLNRRVVYGWNMVPHSIQSTLLSYDAGVY